MRSGQCESCLEPERHLQPEWLLKMSLEFNGEKYVPVVPSPFVCQLSWRFNQTSVATHFQYWRRSVSVAAALISFLLTRLQIYGKRSKVHRRDFCQTWFAVEGVLFATICLMHLKYSLLWMHVHTHTHTFLQYCVISWPALLFLFSIFDHSCGACCSVFVFESNKSHKGFLQWLVL